MMFSRQTKTDGVSAASVPNPTPIQPASPAPMAAAQPLASTMPPTSLGGTGSASGFSGMSSFGVKRPAASIITPDMKVKGDIESEGDIQLEGEIHGTVRAPTLTVAESGAVYGDIYADTLRVLGKVVGATTARVADLAKTAHVTGDIFHQSLTIETGAYIDGHCKRVDTAEAPRAEPVQELRTDARATRPRPRIEPVGDTGGDRIAQMLSRLENPAS